MTEIEFESDDRGMRNEAAERNPRLVIFSLV